MTFPRLATTGRRLGVTVPFAQTAGFLACGCQTTAFAVLYCLSSQHCCLKHSWWIGPTPPPTPGDKGEGEKERPYLVNGFDDPVDARVTTDGLVLRVDEDDFVVFVSRVLVDPV